MGQIVEKENLLRRFHFYPHFCTSQSFKLMKVMKSKHHPVPVERFVSLMTCWWKLVCLFLLLVFNQSSGWLLFLLFRCGWNQTGMHKWDLSYKRLCYCTFLGFAVLSVSQRVFFFFVFSPYICSCYVTFWTKVPLTFQAHRQEVIASDHRCLGFHCGLKCQLDAAI